MKNAFYFTLKAFSFSRYLKLVFAIFYSFFLKEQYVSWLFQMKYFEIKFNLQLLYLPIVSRAFILSWATTRCPPS